MRTAGTTVAAAAAALVLILLQDVILASLDRVGTKDVGKFVAAGMAFCP